MRPNEVYIENLYTDGLSVYALVSYDAITIPFQVIDGYEIEGAGTIYNDDNFELLRSRPLFKYN